MQEPLSNSFEKLHDKMSSKYLCTWPCGYKNGKFVISYKKRHS